VHAVLALVDEDRDRPSPPRSLRRASPLSKRTNSIRSEDPIASCTAASSSAAVVASANARRNSFMSGWPMVAVSRSTTSSNGLDETTLNRLTRTSIVGISLAPGSPVSRPW